MFQFYLGIDIAKETFDAAMLGNEQTWRGQFANDRSGFDRLERWLSKRKAEAVHACMEASGNYWVELALFLQDQGYRVSVVNPELIKRHAEAIMQRNKTDREDALTIADYCAKHQPELWSPPPPACLELRAIVRHVMALKADRQRERNRRRSGVKNQEVLAAIDAHIVFIDAQIEALEQRIHDHIDQNPRLKRDKALLKTIPGIGDMTAAVFLAEVTDISRFSQAPELAAFAGLVPGRRYSGTSIRSPGHIVKWGNSHLRAILFMPAMAAHRWNPIIAALKERMTKRGKSKMTIIIASMRKLLHLCYGVLKTGKPFDPNHNVKVQIPA
jgi:transposase